MTIYQLGERALKLGDRGNDVKRLQALLIVAGYDLTADGNFGLGTQAAVKAFQRAYSLPADGVAGSTTIATLQAAE